MPLNPQKLTWAQYRERYSGLEMLYDVGLTVGHCAATMDISPERFTRIAWAPLSARPLDQALGFGPA
jgi:hypothetical protein